MSLQAGAIDLSGALDPNGTGLESNLFEILNTLLQPNNDITPGTAAQLINKLVPATGTGPHGNPRVTDDDAEEIVWAVWETLAYVSTLVPHDHEGQDTLVELLKSLTGLPRQITRKFWGVPKLIWADLPLLGACMRDSLWWDGEDADSSDDLRRTASEWINLNALLARILAANLARWINFAVWELCVGLEKPPAAPWILDCQVAVAAQWILRGGERLWRLLELGELGEFDVKISEGVRDLSENFDEFGNPKQRRHGLYDGTYKGKLGLVRERWEYWKMRFGQIADEAEGNASEWAARAAVRMREIDGQGSLEAITEESVKCSTQERSDTQLP